MDIIKTLQHIWIPHTGVSLLLPVQNAMGWNKNLIYKYVECWTAKFICNLKKKNKTKNLHINHMEIPDLLFHLSMPCAFACIPYQYLTLY